MLIRLECQNDLLRIGSDNGRLNKRTRIAVIRAAMALADLQTIVKSEINTTMIVSDNCMSMLVNIEEKG